MCNIILVDLLELWLYCTCSYSTCTYMYMCCTLYIHTCVHVVLPLIACATVVLVCYKHMKLHNILTPIVHNVYTLNIIITVHIIMCIYYIHVYTCTSTKTIKNF